MTIKEKMTAQGFSQKFYALSRGLDYSTFKHVVGGAYEGKKRGKARECVQALYRDGLLPEAHAMYEKMREAG